MAQKSKRALIAFFLGGFSGIVSQTILLRELLVLFSGNELSICVITGFFILEEALGAFCGGTVRKEQEKRLFICTLLFSAICFPLTIYVIRSIRMWLFLPLSVSLSLTHIIIISFITLFPSSFLHGLFFTLSCSVYEKLTNHKGATGKVYFYEMAGTVTGGIITSLILISYLNSFTISFISGLSLCLVSFFLLSHLKIRDNKLFLANIFVAMFLLSGLVSSERLHFFTVEKLWGQREVLYYRNSPYQNIVITKEMEEINVFLDGIPYMTFPHPDIAEIEVASHLPMLSHEKPEDVLIIGGGLGGMIRELGKYRSVKSIDYVDIDPYVVESVKTYIQDFLKAELQKPSLTIHITDGRIFVKRTDHLYDVIILCLDKPSTLEKNRYFTKEFFRSIKSILKDGSLFVFFLPGSSSYYSEELSGLNGTVLRTAISVFPSVFVVPSSKNLFLASKDRTFDVSPSLLYKRLKERGIETQFLSFPEFSYLLEKRKRTWVMEKIGKVDYPENRDFFPTSFLYYLSYLNLSTSPYLRSLFQFIRIVKPFHLFWSLVLLFIGLFLLQRRFKEMAVPLSIATTGFASFVLEMVLIFSFQTIFGSIYSEIGLLFAIFMGGMAVASVVSTYSLGEERRNALLFLSSEMFFSLFLVGLFFFLPSCSEDGSKARWFIYVLLFFSGGFAGLQFPWAVNLYGKERTGVKVSRIYASDLSGGFFGSIFGFFFIPAVGFINSILFLSALKTVSLALLIIWYKKGYKS